jgi:REP element-mobilizing transposase RayT
MPHQARPVQRPGEPVHVTLRTKFSPLRHQFVFPTVRGAIAAANRRARTLGRFRVAHFSIQHDHIHLIVEAVDRKALWNGVRGLSVSLARRINRLVFRRGQFIADRWHGRALRSPRAVRHALVYVLGNFRKHTRSTSLVDAFSSAPYFTGFVELVNCQNTSNCHARASPVEPARSWLLARGWRQHGDISVLETPCEQAAARRQRPRQ